MAASRLKAFSALFCLPLCAACASAPAAPLPAHSATARPAITVARSEAPAALQALAYHQRLQTMSAPELARERGILVATAPGPAQQFRLALVLAQIHGTGDLARAQSLLEQVLRSTSPAAQELHGVASVFAAQYQERNRLEQQNERLGQQLKELQQRNEALQEKLDAMADIERSLAPRPAAPASPPR